MRLTIVDRHLEIVREVIENFDPRELSDFLARYLVGGNDGYSWHITRAGWMPKSFPHDGQGRRFDFGDAQWIAS